MNTDQLIEVISNLCLKLLPVLGVVLLIYLVILVVNANKTMKSLDVTLSKTNDLVDECKGQIRKLDKPLNTIGDLSETVDDVHASAKNAVNSAINTIATNMEHVKEWISNLKNKPVVKQTVVNEEKENSQA